MAIGEGQPDRPSLSQRTRPATRHHVGDQRVQRETRDHHFFHRHDGPTPGRGRPIRLPNALPLRPSGSLGASIHTDRNDCRPVHLDRTYRHFTDISNH